MGIRISLIIFLNSLAIHSTGAPTKFPIYKLGIKFSKPSNYFLATTDNANKIRQQILKLDKICVTTKKAVETTFSNPNFKIFINEKNYNEQICFNMVPKVPDFSIGRQVSSSIKEKIKEQCVLGEDISIKLIRDTTGICSFGDYSALLFKITTQELSYYSEGFFIEGKTGTIILTVNSTSMLSNQELVNSIENISSERYEGLISDINKLMTAKDYRRALLKADTCIRIEPRNVRGIDKRMALNLYFENYQEVINDANLIISIDEDYLNGQIVKGLAYCHLKEYTKAIESFELAQQKLSVLEFVNLQNEYYSSFSMLYRLKGDAFLNLKNGKKAIENLEAALELSVDSFNTGSIYYNLGVTKSSIENNSDEAIKYYSLAILNYPKDNFKEKSEALFNRGINYRKKGKNQEALDDYSQAIKLRPDYAKAYNNRAVIKLNTEDYKGAIIDCSAAIKFDAGKTEITGMAYYTRGVAKFNIDDMGGCEDMKKAKTLGQTIPKEIRDGCQIK